MKKYFYIFLLILLLLLFVGCDSSQNSSIDASPSHSTLELEIDDTFSYKDISLQEVDSTALWKVGYDYSHQILVIKFRENNEPTYVYSEIPSDIYESLINADSIGRFYNYNIKGQYPIEKFE